MPLIDKALTEFLAKHQLPKDYLEEATLHFAQLINNIHLLKIQHPEKVLFIGINGCQGSGKSTLADYLITCLNNSFRHNAIALSLDDFYLNSTQRQKLADTVHPLFKTRGVPGTHSTALLKQTLADLADKKANIAIPRFNKAIDNPYPVKEWPVLSAPADIVVLEGWCWGVESQNKELMHSPINELERLFDPKGIWRSYVNNCLHCDYQPLYKYMDYWVMLKAPSFNSVLSWRLEQENKLRKSTNLASTHSIMTTDEVAHFIQHFQRLTEHGLSTLSQQVDTLFELDSSRKIKLKN